MISRLAFMACYRCSFLPYAVALVPYRFLVRLWWWPTTVKRYQNTCLGRLEDAHRSRLKYYCPISLRGICLRTKYSRDRGQRRFIKQFASRRKTTTSTLPHGGVPVIMTISSSPKPVPREREARKYPRGLNTWSPKYGMVGRDDCQSNTLARLVIRSVGGGNQQKNEGHV